MNKLKIKKGFTLIELLAVIVILAIIALIAVPVVMNIIEKAQKSSFKDSAYGVLNAADLYYAEQQMNLNEIEEYKVFIFPNDIEGLKIKGSKPTGGSILVRKDGEISMAITNGKHCVTKLFEDKDITITDDATNCKNPPLLTLTYLATTKEFTTNGETKTITPPLCVKNKTKCDLGTPIAIKVNNTQTYKFYVINDDGNEVTLIMDRNLGEKVAWYKTYDENRNGPVNALNYLNGQTSDWNNIPSIASYTYDNNKNGTTYAKGYQKLEIVEGKGILTSQDGQLVTEIEGKSKARLLTYEEVTSTTVGCSTTAGSCPSWIYENLSDSNTNEEPNGYWLLTTMTTSHYYVRRIYYDGKVNIDACSRFNNGIRPVITLSK